MVVNTKTGSGRDENSDPNIKIVVAGAGLNTYIQTIPDAKDTDIIAKCKHKTLTQIKDKPNFESMKNHKATGQKRPCRYGFVWGWQKRMPW